MDSAGVNTPNTFTTRQYLGILGDFSRYWIADALDMMVQRLVELYAASNQEGRLQALWRKAAVGYRSHGAGADPAA